LKKEKKMRLHPFNGKLFFALSFLSVLLLAGIGHSLEEDVSKYPSRPITCIVPYPPGGPTDLNVRSVTKAAEKFLGQPFVIVNKPGGGGSLGMAAIAFGKPDGYTIGFSGNSPLLVLPHIEKLPYDPIKDFKQIIQYGGCNFGIFVKSDSPFNSFKDAIIYARQNPKKLTYGALTNSIQLLIIQQIAKKEGVELTFIPFKGTPEVQTAILGGHILMGLGDFNYSLVDGKLIKLVLLLREEHSDEYPQTPILRDLGYTDVPAPWYFGMCGPKGMPSEIVKRLEDAFTKAMKEPIFVNTMKELRLPIVYRTNIELDAYVARNYEVFGKICRESLVK
jgi:tripartite-type tricarboxylate transporter receptor subunit TctC